MKTPDVLCILPLVLPLVSAQNETEATWPLNKPGGFTISNFTFDSGKSLDELAIHYQTLGELKFLNEDFAGTLFNPGQILDAEKYFIILRDGIGHGDSSTPRNTDLRADFPSYQYSDMVRADHQLLTEHLGINHTRLIGGVSMGGMHTWMWGEEYPDFMDALFPIASLPAQIAGHNRMWRKMFMELIQRDPACKEGNYETQPLPGLVGPMSVLLAMFESPLHMARKYPTRDAVDAHVDATLEELLDHRDQFDANNLLYAYNASYTYDPEAQLGSIKAPLTAVNTADDLLNPPDLRILERAVDEIMVESAGKAVVIPASTVTFGHGSYIKADLWEHELEDLLLRTGSAREAAAAPQRRWSA